MVAFNNFRNRFRKGKGKAKKVAKAKVPPRRGGMTFAKRVNAIIARNIENKYTDTKQTTLPVLTMLSGTSPYSIANTTYTHLTWTPGSIGVGLLDISQGTAINERVGNTIKIKRWVVKGIVQPNPSYIGVAANTNTNNGQIANTSTGYIDIYFGRLLNNLQPPPTTLENFYQNGAVDITPHSQNIENLYRVNKDLYKVYWHKRFKMSTGNVGTTTTNLNFPQSNDFQMTRSFGFDITKYILKNKQLKYDEVSSFPQQGDLNNLSLWAIWHPAVGNPVLPTPPTYPGSNEQRSFYQINLVSYGEFEDA